MTQAELDKRFTYHPPKGDQQWRYEELRKLARYLAQGVSDLCPEGREQALAFTALEEAIMWANAAIARF